MEDGCEAGSGSGGGTIGGSCSCHAKGKEDKGEEDEGEEEEWEEEEREEEWEKTVGAGPVRRSEVAEPGCGYECGYGVVL